MMNRRIDPWLLLIVAILITFGLVMVYSASAMVSADWTGDETQYVKRQLIAIVAGGVMCIGSAITPMRSFRIYRYRFYFACMFGLFLCFAPSVGHTVKGASRWVGFGAFHVQPSEFAKIAMLIVLADYLHRWRGHIEDPRIILKSLLIPLPLMVLIIPEPDFGSTAIMGGLAAMMLLIAGVKIRHIVITGVIGLAVGFPVMIAESYRVRRLTSFLNPWADAQGDGFHTIQSWLAMHSGGLWGQGLGNSIAKLHFLPEPWTDYIAAVIAEELGFVGLIVVITLYGLFVWRGMYIARRARDAFSTYLAATLTGMVGFEGFFNLGVVMGMLPPKGLVLPFLSYGATAMMSHLWAVGILLSIAAEADDTPIEKGWHRPNRAATPARDTPLEVAGK